MPNVVNMLQSDAEAAIKAVGLVVGTVSSASNSTTPSGKVNAASPAQGTLVNPGSVVNLEISSGPAQTPAPTTTLPGQASVPDLMGLTRQAALKVLGNVGLVAGPTKTLPSSLVPEGGIISTDPPAGTSLQPASAVELHVSSGKPASLTEYIPTVLFTLLGIVLLGVIVYGVTQKSGNVLTSLANKDVARGLITFLIAIATVGIAIILAISTIVLPEGDEGDKRFDRGKQVLTILIGVLGTIVGFYFGSAPDNKSGQAPTAVTGQAQALAITTSALPTGKVNAPYSSTTLQATGGTQPLKWSVKPSTLPAGLALDPATGTISGTPTATFPPTKFTFTVTDSATPSASPSKELTLEIK